MTHAIPKLRRDVKITENGFPSFSYHRWWDELARNLDGTLDDIEEAVTQLQMAFEAIEDSLKETARISSYPAPTVVLTAADVGADATITIADHTRVYPLKGPLQIEDVDVIGGTITGLAFSTTYYVYYDDETLTDTTPTYVATTSLQDAQVGAASGRHFVGRITTPADGAGNTTGTGPQPPGGIGDIP